MATTAHAARAGGRPAPLRWARRALTQREASIVVVTAFVVAFFALRTDRFFTSQNFVTLLPYFAPVAILAVGEVLVMMTGEIDLSIGTVYLFAPYMVYEFDRAGLPLAIALGLALLCGAAVGVVNGVVTTVFRVSSFIATLAMLLGLGGFTLIISHGAPVVMPGSPVTEARATPPLGIVFGASRYAELIWALVAVATVHVVLRHTRWGIYTVATGDNRTAAAEAGIHVRRVVTRNFVVCGLFAALVGILEAMRTSSVTPDTTGASETMFRAIAAAVIGGTLLTGGAGTAIGALVGAVFLGVLRDGLTLSGTSANYLDFILGAGILIAMTINVFLGRARRRSGQAAA